LIAAIAFQLELFASIFMDKNGSPNLPSSSDGRMRKSSGHGVTDTSNDGHPSAVSSSESVQVLESTSGLQSTESSTSTEQSDSMLPVMPSTQNWMCFIEDLIQSELKCAICQEVLVSTTNLNCSHVFCECCISEWLRTSPHCPVCRVKVDQSTRVLALDNLLSRYFEHQKPLIAGRRKELIEERRRLKQSQQKRWRRTQRDQDMIVTRRNIRLLHEPIGDLDLAQMAMDASGGVFPYSPYRLLLNRSDPPALLAEFGRHFQPAALFRRGNSRNARRIDLIEHGLVDLQLELRDPNVAEDSIGTEAMLSYLERVGQMVDHVYRVQSHRERNRRQNRVERQRTFVDTEQMRRLRDQERNRRAQRLARRDLITRHELDLD
jgi:hypothetical protein